MYQMGPLFMLPPAYYRLYRPVVIPQPFSGYSPQAILNYVPNDKLGDYQRAFLSGEDLPPVGNFPPSKNPVDLSIAICQSLSACGSLKKGPTPGTGQPNQEMEPSVKPTISTAKQGYAQTLSGWMKDFPGSSEHNAALEKAIQSGPEDLARQKQDIWISDHIDFGLKHAGSTWYKSLPRYFRTFIIVNTSEQAVVLLDVCGVPSVNHTFVLHDDYGLAHHYHSRNHHKSDPKGVILPRHSQYQVTIELQCNPEDCALHQQWLMFTFAVIDWKVKSKLAADKGSVFTISRRISALVVKHVQDVQTCLSIEAKPFYPLSLRAVFDKEPAQFSYADKSPCKKYMDFVRTQNSSRQIGHLSVWKQSFTDLEKCIEANDRDQASVLSSNVDRQPKKDRIPPLSSQCSCYKRQLVQLVRLLGLEEAAMELDIREHDLLNTLMECIDYQENRFRIEVPGLPENRPSVFKGDVVYVRWATMPHLECAALVLAVEMQPKPQIIIKLSAAFISPLVSEWFGQVAIEERILRLNLQRVHVRFMIDRLIIKNMHTALRRTASSPAKLLPCMCTGITNTGPDFELAKPDPDSDSDEKRSIAGKKFLINKCLNEEQQMAVKAVLNMVDGPGPYIIFGPPGTGKTVTVVECVLQVLKSKKSSLLCVCAPSNYAADILCSGISKGGISPGKMWRFNDPRRTVDSVKADVIKFCSMADGVFTNMHPNFSTLRVIVCTCAAAAMLHEDPTKSRVSFVTHIFIDEAGQALVPETLIPLSLANQDTCCVLCGDPKQLGPVVHSKLAATNGLAKSLLEHFTLSPQYKLEGPNRPSSARVIKLLRNYRANGKLLELPSRMFYENELIASAEEQSVAPPEWEEMNDISFPMLFYGVKGQQMREGESPSYFNAVEITKVADLITGLIEKTNVRMEDIGVMAPYRRQVHKLRLVLRARNMRAIRVGTVDDYQGQEEKIMFISTVLTRPESLRRAQTAGAPEQNIGFLSNAKRFNVAITRAKAMLVVVGHPVILSADENWQVLLRHCLSRGAYRGYGRDRVPVFLPSSSALRDPFSDTDEPDDELDAERNEMDNAIERIAEMSLLGLGDVERLYPDTLDSYYAANSEDQEWRVVL